MDFMTGTFTDVGTRKKTNQDSMLVLQASSKKGNILFASMCDGMGGLAKGEVASCAMVRALEKWFAERLPELLLEGFDTETLWMEWGDLVRLTSQKISAYGSRLRVELGTTCSSILIIDHDYYIMNVGDSRVYLLSDNIYQLTKDQTYVQREVDAGRMTYEQSLVDPHRSVLLQCIGASRYVEPEFSYGQTVPGQVFLLCCDGFRHVITPQEFYQELKPKTVNSRKVMEKKLEKLTRLNIERGEDDNISAILVKTL